MNPDPDPNPEPNPNNPNNLLETIILLGYNVQIGCKLRQWNLAKIKTVELSKQLCIKSQRNVNLKIK